MTYIHPATDNPVRRRRNTRSLHQRNIYPERCNMLPFVSGENHLSVFCRPAGISPAGFVPQPSPVQSWRVIIHNMAPPSTSDTSIGWVDAVHSQADRSSASTSATVFIFSPVFAYSPVFAHIRFCPLYPARACAACVAENAASSPA